MTTPTLTLHTLTGANRKRGKRFGRGLGSGRGTYSGRGVKGQRARSGGKKGLKRFGMKAMIQTLPKKRGFVSQYSKPQTVSLGVLAEVFADGARITPALLKKYGLIEKNASVKILTGGTFKKKLVIVGCAFSQSAKKIFRKAGGTTK